MSLPSEDNEDFTTEDEFEDENIPESFSCKYCIFESPSVDDLDEHIITHEEAIFEDSKEYEEIMLDNQTRRSPQSNCTSKDINEEVVNQSEPHILTNKLLMNKTGQLPAFYQQYADRKVKVVFVCPYCGYQTMKYFDLHRHLKIHSQPVYSCAECIYMTKRKQDMNKHLLIHCTGSVPMFKCTNCPYVTTRKYHLTRHLHCHANNVGLAKDNFLFKCTECGYTSKRLSDLHRHAVLHCDRTVSSAFKCTKCDYASAAGNYFAKHVLSHCTTKEMSVNISRPEGK